MGDKKTPEVIMGMKSNSNAIVMHVSQLGASLVPRLIMECNNADYWHKFVIGNVAAYERDFILKTIIDFVHPADLIPVNFVKKKRAFFLARNCLDALLKLASSKLVIPNPLHPNTPLRVVVIANHYPAQQLKFDFEENILTVLKKRFNPETKLLNLKEFHKDGALNDFFLLSQPKLMLYVIQFAVELKPKEIDLSNNFLKTIIPLRLLSGCKIKRIDMRNNEISRMEDLEPLKDFKELEVLKLDGNPVCREWESFDYIKKLREICPAIVAIDGAPLPNQNWPLLVKKNFLCSYEGGDLTAQFLEHFFMIYDSENRQKLAPLYHENAMFSVTYRIIPEQKSCQNIQLNHYRAIDRNSKSFQGPRPQFLFQGRKAIMKVFASFPRSNHDPFEFKCDLIYFAGIHGILVVSGVFREDKRYIGFTRNFVLLREDNAYRITNDQLHVYNALNVQMKSTDCFPIRVEITGNPLPFYPDQFTELQKTVHKITGLNYDYSQRYLETSHYDLKKTLEYFVDMHLRDEVPPEAFIQSGKKELLNMGFPKVMNSPYPKNIMKRTLTKHPVVAARTVWQTLKDDRLAAEYIANNAKETQELGRECVKNKILTAAPSIVTAAPSIVTAAPSIVTAAPSILTAAPSILTAAPSILTAAPSILTAAPSNSESDLPENYRTKNSRKNQTISVPAAANTNNVTLSKSQRKKLNRKQRLLEKQQKQMSSEQETPKASIPPIPEKDLGTLKLKPNTFVPAADNAVLTQWQNMVTDTDVQKGNGIQGPAASYGNSLQLESPKVPLRDTCSNPVQIKSSESYPVVTVDNNLVQAKLSQKNDIQEPEQLTNVDTAAFTSTQPVKKNISRKRRRRAFFSGKIKKRN